MKFWRTLRTIAINIAGILLVCLVLVWPLDYVIFLPGKAYELSEMVSLPDAYSSAGSFMMTAVLSRNANLLLMLRSALPFSGMDVYPAQQIRADQGEEEYHQSMLQSMANSKQIASAVAMSSVGYEINESRDGLIILSFTPGNKVEEQLAAGDIIVAYDGKPIRLQDDMVQAQLGKQPGDRVVIEVLRDGERLSFEIELSPRSDNPAVGGIGIMTTVVGWKVDLPLEVNISSADIGGASAGLMLTLEIMDQLLAADLTHGRQIAGTGTISMNQAVGAVGGVKQKVLGAIESKAEYFLTPLDNYAEALSAAGNRIQVIGVAYLADALVFLDGLG